MYGENPIYFKYRSYGIALIFLILPIILSIFGLVVSMMSFTVYPFLVCFIINIIMIIPGFPRMIANSAFKDLKKAKYKKALMKTARSLKLPFAPGSVHIFYAYLLVLNGEYNEALDRLKEIKTDKLLASEKQKITAVTGLAMWKSGSSEEEVIQLLGGTGNLLKDESILFVIGKVLNTMENVSMARKYNQSAYEQLPENSAILSNLVISFCRTKQVIDAKRTFRILYNDRKPTSDAIYYMARIKEKDGKTDDAAAFIKKALEFEQSAVDLISRFELEKYLDELNH